MSQERGPWFEELARVALAAELSVPLERIRSTRLPGVAFGGEKAPEHQIDLYIEDETAVSLIDTIIECRWRREGSKVDQGDVQGVITVRESTRASKAIIVTNTGFTDGAERLAKANKVGLTVIRPEGAALAVPIGDRPRMQADFTQALAGQRPAYSMQVVTRSLPVGTGGPALPSAGVAAGQSGPSRGAAVPPARPAPAPSTSAGAPGGYTTRVITTGRSPSGGNRGGGGFRRG